MNLDNKRKMISALLSQSAYYCSYTDYEKAYFYVFKAEELFFEEFGENFAHDEYVSILERKL